MKDPLPLLDDGATDFELQLLQAGDAEGPSFKAQQATLSALGLGGAALASTSSAAAAGGVALAGTRVLAAKWWAIAALAAASVGGLGYLTLTTTDEHPPGPAPTPSSVAIPLEPPPPPPPPVSVARVSAAPSRAASLGPSPRTSTTARAPDIQAQIALIDRARAAVAGGNPTGALTALDDYASRFPNGVLGQEAAMLRIEALLARGDKSGAARVGKRFLEQHPRSALAPRVRALTGG